MKRILTYLILLISLNCLSQNTLNETDSITLSFKGSLIKNNVKQFFSMKRYCHGCYAIDKNGCITNKKIYFKTYIFWKDSDNSNWLKLLDNCGAYKKIKISNIYINYFIENFTEIKSKQVKKYSKKNSKTGRISEVGSNHYFMERFKFQNDEDHFKTYIDYFDISNDRNENVYFEYNTNLKIVKLSKMISELIDQLENSNSFIRE